MWLPTDLGKSLCYAVVMEHHSITNLTIPELHCAGSFSLLNNNPFLIGSTIACHSYNEITHQAAEVTREIYDHCVPGSLFPHFLVHARAWGKPMRVTLMIKLLHARQERVDQAAPDMPKYSSF